MFKLIYTFCIYGLRTLKFYKSDVKPPLVSESKAWIAVKKLKSRLQCQEMKAPRRVNGGGWCSRRANVEN